MKTPHPFAEYYAKQWYGEKHPLYVEFLFFLSNAFEKWIQQNEPKISWCECEIPDPVNKLPPSKYGIWYVIR